MLNSQRITIGLLVMSVFAACGCDVDPEVGYTTRDQYIQGVSTIYVPLWNRNRSIYRRELESRLTEAVIKEIQATTHYRIAAQDKADSILTGEIVRVYQEAMANNPDTGHPREKEIIVVLAFQWVDLRNGEMLAKETSMEVTTTYIPDFDVDFFQGSEALFGKAAREVVKRMEAPW